VIPQRFFLDESGHSGDLVRGRLDFAGQPIFALACIGVRDEAALSEELKRLRRDHRLAGAELKSSALRSRLPAIGGELARFVIARNWPIFVEVVEKRFFVAIHIVNNLLCGGMGTNHVDLVSRNLMAEYIADHGPDDMFQAYIEACERLTIDQVRAVIEALWRWTDAQNEATARLVQVLTLYARDRVQSPTADPASFLPIADVGPNGKAVWMLPNLQCLTNIYARINQYAGSALGCAELIHDEQLQYGKVLEDAKAQMEELATQAAMPFMPFADYRLLGAARLSFATSLAEPCIQAADLLAGFTNALRQAGPRGKRSGPAGHARGIFRPAGGERSAARDWRKPRNDNARSCPRRHPDG
jgi:hypothetical protein